MKELTKMNVFITGASGFIGKRLMDLIASDNRFKNIYCLCRNSIDLPQHFTAVHGSLEDLSILPATEADVCIHLAAITNSSTAGGDEVFKTNTDGTASVIDYCKRSNIKKIVFLSSINVYLSQKHSYALSKLAAEELIVNSGLDYSILRSSLVYGSGCETFEKIIRFIKTFHLVPVLGNGKAYEQPIYVDEACRAIISHTLSADKSTTCDLFGKTKMSYNEMVKEIAKAINSQVLLLHIPVAPINAVSDYCAKRKIPFPIIPEQIAHMCEDLCCQDGSQNPAGLYELDDFSANLNKYLNKKTAID